MKLQDVFDQLTGSELSQLSIGGQSAGEINEANAPKVIDAVNLALTAIYTRFALKEGRLVLQPVQDQVQYAINSKYAVQNVRSKLAPKYLLDDAAAPFVDDVLKIERVLTAAGDELPLNREDQDYSAFTPSALQLRLPLDVVNQIRDLPDWLKTPNLVLVYRANHKRISREADAEIVVLELPDTHLEPLVYHVASRFHTPTGMNTQVNAGDGYLARYEAACQRLEGKGLQVDSPAGYGRFERAGWV